MTFHQRSENNKEGRHQINWGDEQSSRKRVTPCKGSRAESCLTVLGILKRAKWVRGGWGAAEWREVMVEGCVGELQRGLGFASRHIVLESSDALTQVAVGACVLTCFSCV